MFSSIKQTANLKSYTMLKIYNRKNLLWPIIHRNLSFNLPESLISKTDINDFIATFPTIVDDITHHPEHGDMPEINTFMGKFFRYVVPGGKKFRGLTTIASYRMLEKPENLTPEKMKLAYVMGWIAEMTQAFHLVVDDLMDQSEMRRGKPAWHKVKGVNLRAVGDTLLLEQAVYSLHDKYFSQHPCFLPTIELLHEANFKTFMGQSIDCILSETTKPRFDLFTMEKYQIVVKSKTSFYTFYMPVALGMYLANITDKNLHKQAEEVALKIGEYFQIQDDFLDCFGQPEVTGKFGNDIREGKCSWLAVMALQKARPSQKEIMEQYYGKSSPEAVRIIRKLYEELNLPEVYGKYREQTREMMYRTYIQLMSKRLPRELFLGLLESFYNRQI